jgi:hypothetical protein
VWINGQSGKWLSQKTTGQIVAGRKKDTRQAGDGFVFLLANPEFYSHLASWRAVIRTPAVRVSLWIGAGQPVDTRSWIGTSDYLVFSESLTVKSRDPTRVLCVKVTQSILHCFAQSLYAEVEDHSLGASFSVTPSLNFFTSMQ